MFNQRTRCWYSKIGLWSWDWPDDESFATKKSWNQDFCKIRLVFNWMFQLVKSPIEKSNVCMFTSGCILFLVCGHSLGWMSSGNTYKSPLLLHREREVGNFSCSSQSLETSRFLRDQGFSEVLQRMVWIPVADFSGVALILHQENYQGVLDFLISHLCDCGRVAELSWIANFKK